MTSGSEEYTVEDSDESLLDFREVCLHGSSSYILFIFVIIILVFVSSCYSMPCEMYQYATKALECFFTALYKQEMQFYFNWTKLLKIFKLQINDSDFDIPEVVAPSLEKVLWDMESEEGSDNVSLQSFQSMTSRFRSMMSHCILQGLSTQIASAAVKTYTFPREIAY